MAPSSVDTKNDSDLHATKNDSDLDTKNDSDLDAHEIDHPPMPQDSDDAALRDEITHYQKRSSGGVSFFHHVIGSRERSCQHTGKIY